MKITFYAHASFRLEADGVVVITDPYKPPLSRFDPIDEPADLVLMSSATDEFHSDPSHIRGEPVVINTLELRQCALPLHPGRAAGAAHGRYRQPGGPEAAGGAARAGGHPAGADRRACDHRAGRPGRGDRGHRAAGGHPDALLQPARHPADRAGRDLPGAGAAGTGNAGRRAEPGTDPGDAAGGCAACLCAGAVALRA
ncbi:MAG: MBL fold metallo-hydrolase [Acetobacteraceae bacterium]|nr:MBL fold metallo-hydrolase [Acetobacteraceae bacterium]